ncbi:MAG: hemerythrin domain-containing protein [Burkholderiales bacterium]|jgi:hemerythrin-like domain-containing protein|nr:hemerythrin domain-containing protein [Burkholderiales bacterium]
MAVALTIIRDEHRALASVLKGLQYLLDPVHSGRQKPDFALMKAILAYIEHFPDRLHHPKEDQYLFPVLRERDPSVCVVLDELERQHHSGPDVIARVAQAMRDCEANASQLASLKQAVDDYADFQWSHMRKEEQEILPAAERALLPADWELIDAAFKSNNDPLVGVERQQEFRELFRRVVNLMPAPMGLGPAQG